MHKMACSKADIKNTNKNVMDESLKRYKEILTNRGVLGLRKELNEHGTVWQSTKLTVAITGNTGSGKSSFINALLNLDEDDSAGVGVVETTEEIRSFVSAHCQNVIIDDLPGVGTQKFPKDTYIADVKMDTYDCFIIIARSRFTENDCWLAEQIQKRGKQFYFIRTHLQEDIENDKRAHPKTHKQETLVQSIKEDCDKNLQKFERKKAFLIDSFQPDDFDFPAFVSTLLQETGGLKANLLATSLATITQEVLEMKLTSLVVRLYTDVALRIATGQLSSAERQNLIKNEIAYYRKVLDVDEETLKNEKLFNLSEGTSNKYAKELEDESKILIENNDALVKSFGEIVKPVIKRFNFSKSIGDFVTNASSTLNVLLSVLEKFYITASEVFKSVPVKFAEKCSTQESLELKEQEFDLD